MARRIVTPKEKVKVEVEPLNVNKLVNDAMGIIGNELAHYKTKTNKGLTLDLKESRAVQGYMDSLVKMIRESREASEQYRKEELEKLSDSDLLKIAQKHLSQEKEEDGES